MMQSTRKSDTSLKATPMSWSSQFNSVREITTRLWEWPPAVCGRHHDPISLARSKGWCEASYSIFSDLARDPGTGVFLRPVTFYFKRLVEEDAQQQAKMQELAGRVRGFRHDPALIVENGVNPELGQAAREAARGIWSATVASGPSGKTDVGIRRQNHVSGL
jgi:hypothetical protein